VHWLLIFGVGMLAMLALWTLGSMLVNWWSVTQDDWHYGRPRIYQTDAVVGHNDSAANPSHFVVLIKRWRPRVLPDCGRPETHIARLARRLRERLPAPDMYRM
jgi:hypothetical protein